MLDEMAGAEPNARRQYRESLLELLGESEDDADDPRAGWDREQIGREQERRDAMMAAGFGGVGVVG